MIVPKYITVPDYSGYIGKEYIVTENSTVEYSNRGDTMLKGVRFIISEIKNSNVTIKISNSKSELETLGMLDHHFNRMIHTHTNRINILKQVYDSIVNEPEMYVVDEDNYWNNKHVESEGYYGHCINTGYCIPPNHPDKYGRAMYSDDTIMTLNYKRLDGKPNNYSYQSGQNEYYSKECYYYMIMGQEDTLKKWVERDTKLKNVVYKWIFEKVDVHVKTLNQIKFELYR